MTAMRFGARFVLIVCVWLLVTPAARGQAPLDALQSSGSDFTGFSYTFDVEYAPGGAEGPGMDEYGAYAYTRQTRAVSYSAGLAYDFNDALSVNARAAAGATTSRVRRTYANGATRQLQERHDVPLQSSFGFTYRFLRETPYAPAVSVAAGQKGSLQAGLAFNHVRDPTVFSASVGHTWQRGVPGDLLISLAAAFVANDRVNFSVHTSHGLPRSKVHAPWTTVELRAAYSFDDAGTREIGVGLSLAMDGDDPFVGFRLTFAGQSP